MTPPASRLFLSDMTWPEAAAALAQDCIVLLPVGAIEAHGPHLPLDTDVIIATETARRTAEALRRRGDGAVVMPPISYGVSFVGAAFPGTVPAEAPLVAGLVEAVLTAVAGSGPRRLAVVNAHLEPAHVEAIRAGVWGASATSGASIACPDQREPRWAATLSEEFRRGSRHAGAYETSLLLAAAPDSVRRDLLAALPAVLVDLPGRLRAGARTFAEAGATEAYVGNPAAASADEGERLFSALVWIDELGPVDPGRQRR